MVQIGSKRVEPGNKQNPTTTDHAISSTKEIKGKHKYLVKLGKCFRGTPMGTLRKITYWLEATSRGGNKERTRKGIRKGS